MLSDATSPSDLFDHRDTTGVYPIFGVIGGFLAQGIPQCIKRSTEVVPVPSRPGASLMYNQNVQLWRFARTAELSVIEIGSVTGPRELIHAV